MLQRVPSRVFVEEYEARRNRRRRKPVRCVPSPVAAAVRPLLANRTFMQAVFYGLRMGLAAVVSGMACILAYDLWDAFPHYVGTSFYIVPLAAVLATGPRISDTIALSRDLCWGSIYGWLIGMPLSIAIYAILPGDHIQLGSSSSSTTSSIL